MRLLKYAEAVERVVTPQNHRKLGFYELVTLSKTLSLKLAIIETDENGGLK